MVVERERFELSLPDSKSGVLDQLHQRSIWSRRWDSNLLIFIKIYTNRFEPLNINMEDAILKLREEGKKYKEIVDILGCSKSMVSYYCNSNVRKKAIQDASEYKKRKRINLSNKTSTDIECRCLNCDNHIQYKRAWSKTNRKFCNKSCELSFKENEYIKQWNDGSHRGYVNGDNLNISTFVRKYIKNKFDNKCAECGWDEPNPFSKVCYLEIHHIDGDAANCNENNLILLCPNCHSLTKNYKFLNEVSSRIKNGREPQI